MISHPFFLRNQVFQQYAPPPTLTHPLPPPSCPLSRRRNRQLKRDKDGRHFPWASKLNTEDALAEPDKAGSGSDAGEAASLKRNDKQTLDNPEKPKPFSKKKQYLPLIILFFTVALAVLSVWPLALAIAGHGKGECVQRKLTHGGVPTDECVEADPGGGATCNVRLLEDWFVVNGVCGLVLILLCVYLGREVWRNGLSNWDLTLTTQWVPGCVTAVLLMFLCTWYIVGNILIWKAEDSVCGTLSSTGRIYFYTTYVTHTSALLSFCVKMSIEGGKKDVRSMETDIEMANLRDHNRRRVGGGTGTSGGGDAKPRYNSPAPGRKMAPPRNVYQHPKRAGARVNMQHTVSLPVQQLAPRPTHHSGRRKRK